MMLRILFACVVVLLGGAPAVAQKLTWEAVAPEIKVSIEPAEVRPGQTATLKVAIKLKDIHYLYPTTQPDPKEADSKTTFTFLPNSELLLMNISDPPGFKKKPGAEGGELAYYPGGTTWTIPIVVSPQATPGAKTFAFKRFHLPVCDNGGCIAKTFNEHAATYTVKGEPQEVEAQYKAQVEQILASRATPVKVDPKVEPKVDPKVEPKVDPTQAEPRKIRLDRDYAADMKFVQDNLIKLEVKNNGLWVFLGTAFTFGIITLLTPCVFPMVPITVSVFLKQSEKQGRNPLVVALIYSCTIVVVLSIAALTLLKTFSALAVNPWMNVALGTLFLVLTLSLFGMFELTLPSSLANYVGNKEGKGGYTGVVFMAISFTIVSFTCVAPFLGGFSGMAASGNFNTFQLVLGALTFAVAFASPFFLLALFPSLLKKLPKSGDWMNTIKVTMGFLELAAAFKFFRTAELRWTSVPSIFTYDLVLAVWIGLHIAMALYLIGLFRMKHDHAEHVHIGPLRLLAALFCVGVAVYLTPALFTINHERQRPGGTLYAWVDAFLLPEPSTSESSSELPWSGDLRRSLEDAQAKNGVVFVDFTGKTCSNCRLNEKNVFVKNEVRALFKQYTLVAIYTDTVPAHYYESPPDIDRQNIDGEEINKPFQRAATDTEMLPTYMILKPRPDGKIQVLGIYDEGKINDEPAFLEFLKNGLR